AKGQNLLWAFVAGVTCAQNKLYEHFVMAPAVEWKKDQETLKRIHESNASNVLYNLKAKEDEYGVMLSIYLIPISYNLKANNIALYKLEEEREHLINIAKPRTENSTVVDSVTGKSKNSRVCTSSGTFLDRGQDETVQAIEKRISGFTFLHVGQKYEPHYDYFLDDYNTKSGGQRMATLLMYLYHMFINDKDMVSEIQGAGQVHTYTQFHVQHLLRKLGTGHSSLQPTLRRLSASFYSSKMKETVTEFIRCCLTCQQVMYPKHKPYGLLQLLPTPNQVWEDLKMDFITQLPSSNGKTTIWMIVNRLTKAAHFIALSPNYTAVTLGATGALQTLSMDDLYNNLKVYKAEIKGQSSSGSNSHNVAFVSFENTTSINETVNAAHEIPAAGLKEQPSASRYVDDVAMITIRVKKFVKKTGRNLNFNGKEPVSFDKTKVECYNCHIRGHFARECHASRNQGNKSADNERRVVLVETPASSLVVQDGLGGYDWSYQAEEGPTNFALLAYSSDLAN
nr:probable prolyl 4-hydroxylase 10 [Tanacetum cinerariifolium]